MRIKFSILLIFVLSFLSACQTPQVQENPEEPPVVVVEGAEEINIGNKICPVCDYDIKEHAKITYEYKGITYNFNTFECVEEFKKDPQKYIEIVHKELKAEAQEKARKAEEEKTKETEPVSRYHEEHLF